MWRGPAPHTSIRIFKAGPHTPHDDTESLQALFSFRIPRCGLGNYLNHCLRLVISTRALSISLGSLATLLDARPFFYDCSGLRNRERLFAAYSLACTSKWHRVSYATQKYFVNHLPKLVQCDSERLRALPSFLVLRHSVNHW